MRLLCTPGDTVSPLCLPDAGFAVSELLPDLYADESDTDLARVRNEARP